MNGGRAVIEKELPLVIAVILKCDTSVPSALLRVITRPDVVGVSSSVVTVLLVPIGASPWLLGYAAATYGVTALVAGTAMVALAERVRRERDGELAERAAQQLFVFSIVYLFVLFAVLLVEGGLGSLVGRWT